MTHLYRWHDPFMYVTWRVHMFHMTQSYIQWRNVREQDTILYMWYINCYIYVIYRMPGMPHIRERDSILCMWYVEYNCLNRIYNWDMWHVWMGHVTYMNGSCHIYEWVMAHVQWSHVPRSGISDTTCVEYTCRQLRHATYVNGTCHIYEWGMSHVRMSHVPRSGISCITYIEYSHVHAYVAF